MSTLPDELRLAVVVALAALAFISSLALSRRFVRDDPIQPLLDAFLLTYLIQYLSVGLPGCCGILNACSIAISAIVLSSLMWLIRPKPNDGTVPSTAMTPTETWTLAACALFIFGEVAAAVHGQAYLPPMANDALTYHLPAAVSWLQSGRLGLYDVWFYNPANTYSPPAGSMFIAWLLAPLGNDALARFVQAPALLFVFLGLIQLCRACGTNIIVASLIATGAALSRPFVSQSILAKDDLFMAGFFQAFVVGVAHANRPDRLAPCRVGIALGLLFSMKYTVLLSAPLIMLLLDAQPRKRLIPALIIAAVIASPWYLRISG